MVNCTLPGNDVHRAGERLELAHRADEPARAAQMRSIASTHSAAAASASRRRPIGTVPAWPAIAVDLDGEARRAVDRGDHADRQVPRLRAPGPARCAAPRRRAPRGAGARRSAMASGSRPKRRSASRSVTPLRVEPRRAAPARTCRRPRGCRAASSRSARPPRRRSPPPRSRTAGACRARSARATHSIADDHAEHAVVLAGVAHGVEMRAEHQARQPGRSPS